MKIRLSVHGLVAIGIAVLLALGTIAVSHAEEETFSELVKRLQKEKPKFAKRHKALLAERYDLSDRPAQGVTMARGKPVQEGVRVKLPQGHDLGRARGDDARGDQDAEALAGGLLPAAAPASRGGRHGVPASRRSTRSRSRPAATSRASISTSIFPSTCCPSSPRRST